MLKDLVMCVGYRHPKGIMGKADGVFIAVQEKKGDMIATLMIYDGCRFVNKCYKYDLEKQIEGVLEYGWTKMEKSDIYLCVFGMGVPKIAFWEGMNDDVKRALHHTALKGENGKESVIIGKDGMFTCDISHRYGD
jgi:hypothetical protein